MEGALNHTVAGAAGGDWLSAGESLQESDGSTHKIASQKQQKVKLRC